MDNVITSYIKVYSKLRLGGLPTLWFQEYVWLGVVMSEGGTDQIWWFLYPPVFLGVPSYIHDKKLLSRVILYELNITCDRA